MPLAAWTCLDLPGPALEVGNAGIAESISASTVRRVLAADAIKPWQHQSWISIRDPDFAGKAKRVLDLYARVWDGQPLGADEYVISADEKTSIQARCRCHPTLPPGTSRTMRVEHDYHRGVEPGRDLLFDCPAQVVSPNDFTDLVASPSTTGVTSANTYSTWRSSPCRCCARGGRCVFGGSCGPGPPQPSPWSAAENASFPGPALFVFGTATLVVLVSAAVVLDIEGHNPDANINDFGDAV